MAKIPTPPGEQLIGPPAVITPSSEEMVPGEEYGLPEPLKVPTPPGEVLPTPYKPKKKEVPAPPTPPSEEIIKPPPLLEVSQLPKGEQRTVEIPSGEKLIVVDLLAGGSTYYRETPTGYIRVTPVAGDPILPTTPSKEMRHAFKEYSQLAGREQFEKAIEIGLVPRGSEYVPPEKEGESWGYMSPRAIREYERRAKGLYKPILTPAQMEEQKKYANWTAEELLYGRITSEGMYLPSPWGVKGELYIPLPDWGMQKVYEAQLQAIELIDPYKVEMETGKYIVRGTPEYPLGERFPETIITYDLPQAIIDEVPENKLKLAGFTDKNITDAKVVAGQQQEVDALGVKYEDLERRLQPYTKLQVSPLDPSMGPQGVIDIGKALNEKAVTEAELIALGYTQENIDRAKVYHKEGWKVWIPVYGTIATWTVASGLERGLAIVGDVLLIVPTVGWLGKAGSMALQANARALAVGIAPKVGVVARIGAAAKAELFAVERLAVAPVVFPLQVMKAPKVALKGLWEITRFPFAHPLETTKGISAIVTGKAFLGEPTTAQLVKLVIEGKAVPTAAVAIPTHGTGVQRVFVSHGLTEVEALRATRLMQIRLSDMIARGIEIPKTIEVPVYEGGELKLTIRYPTTRAMRELGLATTATPFAERVFTGAAEPVGEGKVYFSTAMSPEWTGVSARGYTTPEAIELGRGGAIVKDMRINRFFDPVSRAYRHSIEVEMTVPEGTQMVTSREAVLEVLKTQGNVRLYPSVVMEGTNPRDIIAAARASSGKVFQYRPVDFTEIQSLPKRSAAEIEAYVRANDMMVGGSTAERTWTRTIKFPEDLDLISIRNNAKVDAENLARIIEQTSGFRARATKSTFRDKWDLEYYDPKVRWTETVVTTDPKGAEASSVHERIGRWIKVGDILDYRVHKTYNPDVLNREPVKVEGIKVEHPLEQTERITTKYAEYQRGEIPLEQHRGHPKRLAWMAEMVLDTPGGRLTKSQMQTLRNIATRIDYTGATRSQLLRLKIGGVLDSVRDFFSPRRVELRFPDGRRVEAPRGTEGELRSFIENRPDATEEEIRSVIRGIDNRLLYDDLVRLAGEGKLRPRLEELVRKDPVLREATKPIVDNIEALILRDLRAAGRFTADEVRAMIYSGVITSGTARALAELTRILGEVPRAAIPREVIPEVRRFIPREAIPERIVAERVPPAVVEYRPPSEERPLEVPYERRVPLREYRPPREPYRPLEEPYRPPRRPPRKPPYPPPLTRKPLYKPPPPPPPPTVVAGVVGVEEEVRIPPGSIAWKQGRLRGGVVWKYIPPPWDMLKPITLVGKVPAGAVRTTMRTPRETIQLIGEPRVRVPETVSVDLGIVDIYVTDSGHNIQFRGGGLKTIVGERIMTTEKGMSIPAKEAPLGAAGLKLGTSFRELIGRRRWESEAQREFAERDIARFMSKMSMEEIAAEIKAAKLSERRIDELLTHLPDRERINVKRMLSEGTYIKVGKGRQFAELRPPWRRASPVKVRKYEEEELMAEEERARTGLKGKPKAKRKTSSEEELSLGLTEIRIT